MTFKQKNDPKGFIENGFVFKVNNEPMMVVGFLIDSGEVRVILKNMSFMTLHTANYDDVAYAQKKWQEKNSIHYTMSK